MTKSLVSLCLLVSLTWPVYAAPPDAASYEPIDADRRVLVVGTGMAGLSAALQAAQSGAQVTVLEMWSVFGGTSFISGGKVAIVGTALQKRQGIHDSPDLAFQDFIHCGQDLDRQWVRYYVDHSNEEIYEWLTDAGVEFDLVVPFPKNSVPRGHGSKELGVGLVGPLFRACASHPRIRFVWNLKVLDLIHTDQGIAGVKGVDTRAGIERQFWSDAVILATGGFQSNLSMIRKHWPKSLPLPERVLTGSGVNSLGIGHEMLRGVGAEYHRMSYVWNYPYGLPDPRDPSGKRGLLFAHGNAIWLNASGHRFVNESSDMTKKMLAMLRQTPACYWAVFDEANKRRVYVAGSDFGNFAVVQRVIYDNSELVKSAPTLEALAKVTGLPIEPMVKTIVRYNAMLDDGEDLEFQRFSRRDDRKSLPPKIEKPPYYAVKIYPLTRKNMGGVLTDHSCRVVDAQIQPIPRLYAAGELSGFAGINGTSALEGTFLGPCVVTGRIAARTAVADAKDRPKQSTGLTLSAHSQPQESAAVMPEATRAMSCVECHDLETLVGTNRPGYTHFEKSHRRVIDRNLDCMNCHAELTPYQPETHQMDRSVLSQQCGVCHLSKD